MTEDSTRYEVTIDPARSKLLVSGMTLIGGGFVLSGLMTSQPLLVLVALVAFSIALYNYPLLREKDPLISANWNGIDIDALGLVAWKYVDDLSLSDDSNNGRPSKAMCLQLNGPLNDIIQHNGDDNALRNLQVRIWRHEPPNSLLINLDTLKGEPGDIFANVERIRQQAFSQSS